jgi:hypothetical protein
MKRILAWICCISILISAFTIRTTAYADSVDVLGLALDTYGYERSEIKNDPMILEALIATEARMVFPWFKRWWSAPLDVPKHAKQLTSAVAGLWNRADGLFQQFLLGASRTGNTVMAIPSIKLEPWPIAKDEPLLDGIKHVYARMGYDFSEFNAEAVRKQIGDTPKEIQIALADFLYSSANAVKFRDRALRNYPREKWEEAFRLAQSLSGEGMPLKDTDALVWDLGQNFDYKDLYYGAIPLMYSIFKMEDVLLKQKISSYGYDFELDTPLGKVAFQGSSKSNEYFGDDYLLIVDCGGNDIYTGAAAATSSFYHPVSLVVDLAGNDQYVASKRDACAQGAGIFGYGILMDYEGNDSYTAAYHAQAAATWGVGLLWDKAGDDTFKSRIFSQGAGQYGIANLVNIGGNDHYYSFYMSQGYGYTMGYGLLLDTEGDDRYIAEPFELLTPGVLGHNDNVNYSLSQGCGFGRRGDLYDGHSMGGGIGILSDLAGNDHYTAGIYAQASGYWFAVGILHDKVGDDKYESYFFTQSGTAHMGITVLLDEAGNDFYNARQAISIGGAHDISISWHIDVGGNDHYQCWYEEEVKDPDTGEMKKQKTSGGILIGSSTANGMGFAVNVGGDDIYEVLDLKDRGRDSLGYANYVVDPKAWSIRNVLPAVGIFIDIGGNDTYFRDICKNNTSWQQESKQYHCRNAIGIGIDIEEGYLPEITW